MERERVAENSKQKDGSESISDDSVTESRESSNSTSSASRLTSDDSCSARLGWPIRRAASCMKIGPLGGKSDSHFNIYEESKLKQGSEASEMEMMKERFAKLLLGEDMSGSGKGVCSALTISNAITNLCATMFGQLWRLEPLPSAKKSMWIREMEWLLAVSDHIVEMLPSWKTFPDGSKLEVMNCRPRSDLAINLPALCKLDNMLLEILDGFTNTEFWYIDQGIATPGTDGSDSFQKAIQRDDDKWWLPLPRVPPDGLSEDTRRQLVHKRECATQILKAATAINSVALAEMEVPESYLETLPKSGRTCLGDVIYRYITTEKFSPDCLLDCLDLSSEHAALEIANRVEAAIYIWRKRQQPKITANTQPSKLSWEIVMDLMVYGDKSKILAERAESLLLLLKQRFPGLTQTTLDVSKIQCNKDVGKAILESYSRVLESLAFNVVARIEDLLYVDNINNNSDKHLDVTAVSFTPHKKAPVSYSVPAPGTPYRTASTTPDLFPATPLNPTHDEIIPLIPNKPLLRAFGVKKALSNYLGGDAKAKINANVIPCSATDSNRAGHAITSNPNSKGKESCYSLLNESRAGEVVER